LEQNVGTISDLILLEQPFVRSGTIYYVMIYVDDDFERYAPCKIRIDPDLSSSQDYIRQLNLKGLKLELRQHT
jgi:hypothetical protein